MEGFLGSAYLWVKAGHIMFVIFWMAGLFMLPRYFAYHVEEGLEGAAHTLWMERERRLLRFILNPAMIIAWVLGLMLVLNIGFSAGGWLHAKLLFVVLLSVFHMVLARWRRELASGVSEKTGRFFRIANEVPSLAIILIVLLVIVRPF